MIPTPPGWMRLVRREYVHLRSPRTRPVGEIIVRERHGPPVSARALVDELLARGPFEATKIVAPQRLTTAEGEHAAVVRLDGRIGQIAIRRALGVVYGEHLTAVADAMSAQPAHFDELEVVLRDGLYQAHLGLGVRERRFVYARPAGWQGVAHALVAHFIPPDHPRNPAHVVVHPARPRGAPASALLAAMFEDQLGAIDELEILDEDTVEARGGLRGRRWTLRSGAGGRARQHRAVVFEDAHYAYPLHCDRGAPDADAVFDAVCASVEPLRAAAPPRRRSATATRLAVVGLGGDRRAHDLVAAIAATAHFAAVELFHDAREPPAFLAGVALREMRTLSAVGDLHALYVPHGRIRHAPPHVLRPAGRAPVVCELDGAPTAPSWQHLWIAAVTGAVRATDVFVVDSEPARRAHLAVWQAWHARFATPVPEIRALPPAIDADAHRRDEAARHALRRELGLPATAVVALDLGATGDPEALAAWREVPGAVLLIAGGEDREASERARRLARESGVAARAIVVDPAVPRAALLSAADLAVALGARPAPAVLLEAMAYGLPVVARRTAATAELVRDGETGAFLAADQPAAPILAALIEDPARRATWSTRARGAIHQHHAPARLARLRIALIDEAAARAAEAPAPPARSQLVALDAVLRELASHRLAADTPLDLAAPGDDTASSLPPALAASLRAASDALPTTLAGFAAATGALADDAAATVAALIAHGAVVARGPALARAPAPPRPRAAAATAPRRDRLAMLGGFVRWDEAAPHGTNHAAYAYACGLARTGAFAAIDAFHARDPGAAFAPPPGPVIRQLPRAALADDPGSYQLVHVAHGDQLYYAPHALRPRADWAPVVHEIGTTHHLAQWQHLLLGVVTGAARATDGIVFASHAARRIHLAAWQAWIERFGGALPQATVISNAIDADAHHRDDALRDATRRELGITAGAAVFLVFGRLSAYTKGDQLALVRLWHAVAAAAPDAVLVLAGATDDPGHVEQLRRTARELGLGARVIVVDNPYAAWPAARRALMSAADALLHLSTGLEETSSLVILEALAHGLPVIASRWSGASELLGGDEGVLVDVWSAPVPDALADGVFGRNPQLAAGEGSRLAACDGRQVIAAVTALATQPTRRAAAAAAARTAVTTRHALAAAMQRRVEFFAEVSDAAAAAWTGAPPPPRELVDAAAFARALAFEPALDEDLR